MIQEQQQTNQWVLTPVQFNLVMLGVADIISPIFLQYGQFNTGKTTLLSYLSTLHGVKNGKVQSNISTLNISIV